MAKSKKASETAEAPGQQRPEDLALQVKHLRRAVLLLMALCLVMSLSLNVYLGTAHSLARRQIDSYEEQYRDEGEIWRLYQRLIIDLKVLSKTDPVVRALLEKYNIPISSSDASMSATRER